MYQITIPNPKDKEDIHRQIGKAVQLVDWVNATFRKLEINEVVSVDDLYRVKNNGYQAKTVRLKQLITIEDMPDLSDSGQVQIQMLNRLTEEIREVKEIQRQTLEVLGYEVKENKKKEKN